MPAFPGGLGTGGNYDAAGGAASVRSGGSRRVPLSARSVNSNISMHVNSYSYLSNRVYDFLQARSSWLGRTQNERGGGDGDEGEDALKVRTSERLSRPLVLALHMYRLHCLTSYFLHREEYSP